MSVPICLTQVLLSRPWHVISSSLPASNGCGSKPMVPFGGRCTTPFFYFSGDLDVHWWVTGLLTHGQIWCFAQMVAVIHGSFLPFPRRVRPCQGLARFLGVPDDAEVLEKAGLATIAHVGGADLELPGQHEALSDIAGGSLVGFMWTGS